MILSLIFSRFHNKLLKDALLNYGECITMKYLKSMLNFIVMKSWLYVHKIFVYEHDDMKKRSSSYMKGKT